MPILIASLVRYVLMSAVQIGAFAAAQAFLEKSFDAIATFFVSTEGVTQDEAEDSIAREVVSAGGALGVNAALIRSRLPVRWADKVSKAIGAPKMTPAGVSKVAAPSASVLSKFKGFGMPGKIFSTLGLSFVASLPWLPSLLQNFLDQGTFNPTNANRALQALGLGGVFQWPTAPKELQPGTYTAGEFLELFEQLTAAGSIGINNTFEQQTQIWDKGNLSALINTIVGDLVIRGKKSDKTAVKKELAKYIISRGDSSGGPVFSPLLSTTPATPPAGYVPTQIKIYTGVVANGALGTPQEFVARPDDMIQNVDELKAAIKNNFASLFQTIPGDFTWEIAIVPSYRTRGGFTVKGAPVQVVSGYRKDGAPRYKTIYHKFALCRVFITDYNGRRIKYREFSCGPVNVVDFQPTPQQLTEIAANISPEMFTGDVGEVKQIITSQPVTVTSTPPTNPAPTTAPAGGTVTPVVPSAPPQASATVPATPPPAPPPVQVSSPAPAPAPAAPSIAKIITLFEAMDKEFTYGDAGDFDPFYVAEKYGVTTADLAAVNPQLWSTMGNPLRAGNLSYYVRNRGVSGINIPISRTPTQIVARVNTKLAIATNLSEAYAALGLSLAPLSTRANLYQAWGLGAASTYAGTAEQNAKLLAEIKKRGAVS